jgi:hypothetical protein
MGPLNMFGRIALIDVMLRRSLGTYRRQRLEHRLGTLVA